MKQRWKAVVTLVAVAATVALVLYCRIAIPVGSGYAAKNLCSWIFVTGADPKRALDDFVAPVVFPLLFFVSTDVDREAQTVTVSSLLFGDKTAVHRDRLGCTLINDITEQQLRAQPLRPIPPPELDPAAPWPVGSADVDPKNFDDVNLDAINRAIDRLMREPDDGTPRQTNAIAVVHRGRLVAERYAEGFDRNTPFLGWSMSKSATNTLMGILVKKGLIDIRAPAPLPAWSHPEDPRHGITVDQLLRMNSGLEFGEAYHSLSQVSEMLHLHDDMARYAYSLPLEVKPNTKWNYSSGTTNILSKLIFDAVGGTLDDYYAFAQTELFQKLGIRSAVFEPDPSGVLVGGSYLFLSARDFARLGLFWLQRGVWNGEQILPADWMAYSLEPTPTAPLRQYGAQFWLNLGDPPGPGGSADRTERIWPRLPTDNYAAVGHHGQYIMVAPAKQVIVVRLGVTFDGSDAGANLCEDDIQYLTETVLSAIPGSPPPAPERVEPVPPPDDNPPASSP